MPQVSTEDRGAVRVITYANAPFGTMTATGSAEMFDAVAAAGEDPSVRDIVITGAYPASSSVITMSGNSPMLQMRLSAEHRASPRPPGFQRSRT